jgi:ribosomal protein L30/L7E
LVSWRLWKQRNACVFDGVSPSIRSMLQEIHEDVKLWGMTGAKDIRQLWP